MPVELWIGAVIALVVMMPCHLQRYEDNERGGRFQDLSQIEIIKDHEHGNDDPCAISTGGLVPTKNFANIINYVPLGASATTMAFS